ncbi:hypothetical protein Syun_016102 [Stephania yunnanensis]|uniref:Uncharacterized protein n=1 Tax=Stephania yunnanensis TaxID=152371 RepID=A0AAP0J5Z6_9MAGN
MKTNLNVFLASNTTEASIDFKIKGSWFDKSLTIYNGNTDTPIAQMNMKVTASYTFTVTVRPNVDYAFVVAIILILDAINREGVGME